MQMVLIAQVMASGFYFSGLKQRILSKHIKELKIPAKKWEALNFHKSVDSEPMLPQAAHP